MAGTEAGARAGAEAGVSVWAGAEARAGKGPRTKLPGTGKVGREGRAGGSVASTASGLGGSTDLNYSLSKNFTLSKNTGKACSKRRAGSTGSTGLAVSAAAALSRTDIDYAASLRGDRFALSRTSFDHAACLQEDRYAMARTCIDHAATFLGRSSAVPRTGTDCAAPFQEGFAASSRAGTERALYPRGGDDYAAASRTGIDHTAPFASGSAAGPRTGNNRPASYRSECFGGANRFSGAGGPASNVEPTTAADFAVGSDFSGVRRNSCALREEAGPPGLNSAGFASVTLPGTAALGGRAVVKSAGVEGGIDNGPGRGRVRGKGGAIVKLESGRTVAGAGAGAVEEEDSLFYLPAVDVRDMGVSLFSFCGIILKALLCVLGAGPYGSVRVVLRLGISVG